METRNLELDGHHGFETKSHPKGGGQNAHFERSAICPKCTKELIVPIGAVLVDDLLQDCLENFVGRFCQSICLRVVWCAFLVYGRVVGRELPNDMVDEVPTFVEYECIMAVFTLSLWTILV